MSILSARTEPKRGAPDTFLNDGLKSELVAFGKNLGHLKSPPQVVSNAFNRHLVFSIISSFCVVLSTLL